MENLYIAATTSSPEINFDATQHLLNIQGDSYPENTAKFYTPVLAWIKDYLAEIGEQEVSMNVDITYFNSSSSKVLMDLFDILEQAASEGKRLCVNWIYDEENSSALEAGEEFQEDLESLPFRLVGKKS